jgi:hypothetical protein
VKPGSAVAVVLAVAALTGCSAGAGAGDGGRATVWVTRDRGAHVLLVRSVPAGLTAMQGLERVARVKTRYGGRFVQAIDGIEGSLSRQHDWLYFVNGYEADRGAAEYRLHDGDVEWWDYRSWKNALHVPVVVGAFPEPFLHGFDGKRRPAVIVYDSAMRAEARRLAATLHARLQRAGTPVATNANVLVLRCQRPAARPGVAARLRSGGGPGAPVWFEATCEANVERASRFHYGVDF